LKHSNFKAFIQVAIHYQFELFESVRFDAIKVNDILPPISTMPSNIWFLAKQQKQQIRV